MLRDAFRGAAATAVMSIPMAARWAAQPELPPPPMRVTERTLRAVGIDLRKRSPAVRHATWIGAHLGFGAAVAAARHLWPRQAKTSASAESYGVAVWAASYALALPALGLYPRFTRDAPSRAVETFASHLVYAAALRKLAQ